jgi:hypothetical protein
MLRKKYRGSSTTNQKNNECSGAFIPGGPRVDSTRWVWCMTGECARIIGEFVLMPPTKLYEMNFQNHIMRSHQFQGQTTRSAEARFFQSLSIERPVAVGCRWVEPGGEALLKFEGPGSRKLLSRAGEFDLWLCVSHGEFWSLKLVQGDRSCWLYMRSVAWTPARKFLVSKKLAGQNL